MTIYTEFLKDPADPTGLAILGHCRVTTEEKAKPLIEALQLTVDGVCVIILLSLQGQDCSFSFTRLSGKSVVAKKGQIAVRLVSEENPLLKKIAKLTARFPTI